MTNLLSEPPFRGLRGNLRTAFIARYKQILVEDGAFQRGWVTLSTNFKWKGTSSPTIVGIRKLECFCYLTVKPRDPNFIRLDTVPACDGRTDRQTDGRTELPWLIQRSALQAMRPSCKNWSIQWQYALPVVTLRSPSTDSWLATMLLMMFVSSNEHSSCLCPPIDTFDTCFIYISTSKSRLWLLK